MKWLVIFVLLVPSTLTAQTTFSDFLTFDGPIHHELFNGYPFVGGGEDSILDDAWVHIDDLDNSDTLSPGDTIFAMGRISDIRSSNAPSRGVNDKQIVVFLSWKFVDNNQLIPHPDGFNVLHSSITTPGNIGQNTVGLLISLNKNPSTVNPPPSALSIGYFDLGTHFTINTHHWELTLDLGTLSQLEGILGNAYATFGVSSSAFEATWLPVDVSDVDGPVHIGDWVMNEFFLLGLTTKEKQQAGWNYAAESQFTCNPIK